MTRHPLRILAGAALLFVALGLALNAIGWRPSWTKALAQTTCRDVNYEMSDRQLNDAAGELLIEVWHEHGSSTEPAPGLIRHFANSIAAACATYPTETFVSITDGIYSTEADFRP